MAQLMPLPLTVSCFSKIQIGFTFLVPAHPHRPGPRAIKWCVCVYYQERQRVAEEKQRRDEERRVKEAQLMTQKAIDRHNQNCQKLASAVASSQVSQPAGFPHLLESPGK